MRTKKELTTYTSSESYAFSCSVSAGCLRAFERAGARWAAGALGQGSLRQIDGVGWAWAHAGSFVPAH
jgi:hypothetical protein